MSWGVHDGGAARPLLGRMQRDRAGVHCPPQACSPVVQLLSTTRKCHPKVPGPSLHAWTFENNYIPDHSSLPDLVRLCPSTRTGRPGSCVLPKEGLPVLHLHSFPVMLAGRNPNQWGQADLRLSRAPFCMDDSAFLPGLEDLSPPFPSTGR